jgi:hypothetical protein
MLVLAIASALSTVLVITVALGSGPVPTAVIAALRHRVVVRMTAHPPAVSTATAASASSAVSPTTNAATPITGGASSQSASSSSPVSSLAGSSGSTPASAPTTTTSSSTTPRPPTSKIKHIFVIALSSPGYAASWGKASVAHYLNRTLRPKGTLLSGYRTLGAAELPDYLAMISGQAPNADTRANCPTYAEFGTKATANRAGQMRGTGCVYPSAVQTIGDQVTAKGKRWKAYLDGLGSTTCVHPNSNSLDDSPLSGAGSGYATRHNPFIYFHSLLDLGDCSNDNVAVDQLNKDLRSASQTPAYSFIAPGLCGDASALNCAPGHPSGLAAEDQFLKQWVPRILSSAAYRDSGALVIVFAAGGTPASPAPASSSSMTPTAPTASTTPTVPSASSTPAPTASTTPAIAAGSTPNRAGALIISPFGRRGKTIAAPYDPYSVLRSTEQLFGYPFLVNASHATSFVKQALGRGR